MFAVYLSLAWTTEGRQTALAPPPPVFPVSRGQRVSKCGERFHRYPHGRAAMVTLCPPDAVKPHRCAGRQSSHRAEHGLRKNIPLFAEPATVMRLYYPSLVAIEQHTMQLDAEPCRHCRQTRQLVSHGYIRKKQRQAEPAKVGKRVFCSNRNHRTGCGRTMQLYLETTIRCLHHGGERVTAFILALIAGMRIRQAYRHATGIDTPNRAVTARYSTGPHSKTTIPPPPVAARGAPVCNRPSARWCGTSGHCHARGASGTRSVRSCSRPAKLSCCFPLFRRLPRRRCPDFPDSSPATGFVSRSCRAARIGCASLSLRETPWLPSPLSNCDCAS